MSVNVDKPVRFPPSYIEDFQPVSPSVAVDDGDFDFSTRQSDRKKIRILAVDGGGIRGIIPARILQEVEDRTHQATAKLFDVMAGTSTGAIVTTALNATKGGEPIYTAKKVVDLYKENGYRIFPYAGSTYGIWAPKYPPYGLDEVLDEALGDTLVQDNYTDCLIPAFETTEYRPWHFTKSQIPYHEELQDLKNRDVVGCTTAAPVYFPSMPLTVGDKQYNFLDGAICSNNPADLAAVYASTVYAPAEVDILCSLGTGLASRSITYEDSKNWGLVGWGPKMPNMMLLANTETVHGKLKYRFPEQGSRQKYFRFQTELEPGWGKLDDASDEHLSYLQEKAETLIEEKEDELNRLCEKLVDE